MWNSMDRCQQRRTTCRNVKYANFLYQVTSEGPCGVIRGSAHNGTVTSPNWPKKYGANQKCLIQLNATRSRFIEISFEYFLLERSPDCSADFLEVYDKGPAENSLDPGRRCGQNQKVQIGFKQKVSSYRVSIDDFYSTLRPNVNIVIYSYMKW